LCQPEKVWVGGGPSKVRCLLQKKNARFRKHMYRQWLGHWGKAGKKHKDVVAVSGKGGGESTGDVPKEGKGGKKGRKDLIASNR